MPPPHSRQTFGLKNAGKAPSATTNRAGGATRKSDVEIHPAILAGGFFFVVAIGAVFMMGGQQPPQVQAGAPRLNETSGGSQAVRPTTQQPGQKPASGGKFGAAADAMGAAR
jgi:hypothetical protein